MANRQVSPFAALSGAEKQIRWLEYQSIRLPYVYAETETPKKEISKTQAPQDGDQKKFQAESEEKAVRMERPQPPPEVPRVMPDMQKTRHGQYDAVIARMKQAELQALQSRSCSQMTQQIY